ncbi:MAG: DUF1194 domain-containing protein [Rhodobacteraceae bacterium]|nr:DUF1194 domain-containing protein [Paracoccaceae bacterium]
MVKIPLAALALAMVISGPSYGMCRQALALGLDVSSSVDAGEYAAQIDGLAQALDDLQVRRALTGTTKGHVALLVYEWGGKNQQSIIQPWLEITDNTRVDQVIATLRGHNRSFGGQPTALGYAMGFGAVQLAANPDCDRQTLDISGDGVNNDGYRPKQAILNHDFTNIVVNGLVISGVDADALVGYFQQEVIYGFGSFVEIANGYDDYARAMKRKLLRELTVIAVSRLELE